MLARVGVLAALVALPTPLSAQRVSPAALQAASPNMIALATRLRAPLPSLAHDVKRGAEIGGIIGGVLGLAGLVAYASTADSQCCEQPVHRVGFRQIVTVEASTTVAGALIGAVLGYSYHFNRAAMSASPPIQPNERGR